MLGLEVLFFCYYRYKRAMLQERLKELKKTQVSQDP